MADNNARGHSMDRELVSSEPHELEYLARTHGASVAEVQAVISEVGSRSRRRIEEELDKRYQHRARRGGQPTTDGSIQSERGLGTSGPSERGTADLDPADQNNDQHRRSNPGADRHSR